MEKSPRLVPREKDAVIPPEKLLPGEFGERAELVVHEGEPPLGVRDGDDGVLVESSLQLCRLLQPGAIRVFVLRDSVAGQTLPCPPLTLPSEGRIRAQCSEDQRGSFPRGIHEG